MHLPLSDYKTILNISQTIHPVDLTLNGYISAEPRKWDVDCKVVWLASVTRCH